MIKIHISFSFYYLVIFPNRPNYLPCKANSMPKISLYKKTQKKYFRIPSISVFNFFSVKKKKLTFFIYHLYF